MLRYSLTWALFRVILNLEKILEAFVYFILVSFVLTLELVYFAFIFIVI